jgi:hypothetical protein
LARKQIELAERDTSEAGLRESLSKHESVLFAVHRIAQERKEAIAKEYADDPDMEEKMEEVVVDWVERELPKLGY